MMGLSAGDRIVRAISRALEAGPVDRPNLRSESCQIHEAKGVVLAYVYEIMYDEFFPRVWIMKSGPQEAE